jgi:ABC-type sugar transport system ATPase subunit
MEDNRKVVLEVRGISKHFGGVKAVENIDFKLYEKEIVAIVGDNGAGKSTFIKLISGVYQKDKGEIYIDSKKVEIKNPSDAKKYRIETVHQSGGVIPVFNASANLFLGREKLSKNIFGKLFKFTDDKYMMQETKNALKKLGIELKDENAELDELSGGQKQSIIVGRAVYWGGRILIFDEPTNNLGAKQEKNVIKLIKDIRNKYNISIIVISHNISHVFELVDRIIVLRNGKKVGERVKEETNPNEIVSLITGLK